jgi:hypothetical protein
MHPMFLGFGLVGFYQVLKIFEKLYNVSILNIVITKISTIQNGILWVRLQNFE